MEEDNKIQTNKTEKVDGMVYLTLDFITSFIVIYITAGYQVRISGRSNCRYIGLSGRILN